MVAARHRHTGGHGPPAAAPDRVSPPQHGRPRSGAPWPATTLAAACYAYGCSGPCSNSCSATTLAAACYARIRAYGRSRVFRARCYARTRAAAYGLEQCCKDPRSTPSIVRLHTASGMHGPEQLLMHGPEQPHEAHIRLRWHQRPLVGTPPRPLFTSRRPFPPRHLDTWASQNPPGTEAPPLATLTRRGRLRA